MIRTLVVDDHAIVRRGIAQIVAETDDIIVAGEARDGLEALEKALNNDYDLVLLDIVMPRKDGLETLKELKQRLPRLAVLVVSMYPEEQYAMRALRSGASGYITKDSAPDELIAAIRKTASGGRYVSASLAEKLAAGLDRNHTEGPLHEHLSDREYQILCMIAAGKTQTQIANELSLSIKTISTYRTRLLKKMSLRNNAEIMRYGVENGLS